MQLDHLAIFVADRTRGADWYVSVLGLEIEFEIPEAGVTAARGVEFRATPQRLPWGYGAELVDPDGHVVCLWDETSMKANPASAE